MLPPPKAGPEPEILLGDVRERLRDLEPGSVHSVVTSPPYPWMRDYGVRGQLGMEGTLDEYLDTQVGVFREVRRVLRPDGTLWLNVGDQYAGGGRGPHGANPHVIGNGRGANLPPGHKEGDPIEVGSMLVAALRNDGWWLRSRITWHKRNPVPDRRGDRPTNASEFVFLLAPNRHYYYDPHAILEPLAPTTLARLQFYATPTGGLASKQGAGAPRSGSYLRNTNLAGHPVSNVRAAEPRSAVAVARKPNTHGKVFHYSGDSGGRPLQNVWFLEDPADDLWTIPTQPYPEAHFAAFPEELASRCIRLGTSEGGVCGVCGDPLDRVVKFVVTSWSPPTRRGSVAPGSRVEKPKDRRTSTEGSKAAYDGGWNDRIKLSFRTRTTGWRRRCRHSGPVVPATVLDPYTGSGAALAAARRLGRRAIGTELNPAYVAIARRRCGLAV